MQPGNSWPHVRKELKLEDLILHLKDAAATSDGE